MNLEIEENIYSKSSMSKAVEISKKITELLDESNYHNNDMLITKEHIKQNLTKLILSKDIKSSIHYKTNLKKRKFSDRLKLTMAEK